ncbi:helix-turn-helix domain-containing protein [Marinomonas algarum]|uniref:Helix-turn-helix domain-containing protein n=1 Tax=Marinomonas algarum TaxID=2883105 RepID=A0A9X1IR89_9GAMM|nr:helix-turn-helix domain-containing protein [Marinomonas algarum]MCB5162608.1 helix-turn-helix domain-containing protein [Marinomonas algarum]
MECNENKKKVELVEKLSDKEINRWVKYQLKIRGLSIAKIADENSVSRQAVSAALNRGCARWEYVVAEYLDMKPHEIWPDRYDNNNYLPLYLTSDSLKSKEKGNA